MHKHFHTHTHFPYLMFQEKRFQGTIWPVVHGICKEFHGYGVYSQKVPHKHYSFYFLKHSKLLKKTVLALYKLLHDSVNGKLNWRVWERKYKQNINEHIWSVSYTSVAAHMRAIEPMLLVMVTRVALARSSRVASSRLCLLIMWPKLETHPPHYTEDDNGLSHG